MITVGPGMNQGGKLKKESRRVDSLCAARLYDKPVAFENAGCEGKGKRRRSNPMDLTFSMTVGGGMPPGGGKSALRATTMNFPIAKISRIAGSIT